MSAARIKQIDKEKNALLKKVDPLIAKKKKLYSNMDITSAKSAEEKQLDKEINDLFSTIQTLILEKRKLINFGTMPIKKKTTAAKKPAAKKPAVLGPKAKLMKLLVGTLRNKAKKLGISDVSKRTKENLAQSIMLAEARKKRGTAMGKKATAKKAASTRGADRQTKGTPNDSLKRDNQRDALPPGRRTSKSGNVYSERRRDRSDKPGSLSGPYGSNNELSLLGYRECGMFAQLLEAWSDQNLSTLAKKYFEGLEDWGFNPNSGFVFLVDQDYNTLMFNESIGKLDLFLSTPYEGQEGFIEDLLNEYKFLNKEDQKFVKQYYSTLSQAERNVYKKPVG